MKKPSPPRSESIEHHSPSFNPTDAIEQLHSELVKIETMALLAVDAADELRPPSDREGKRELIRMQILVGQTAEAATAAVTRGDEVMAALTAELTARRNARESDRPADR
jgi:hypothetical protein